MALERVRAPDSAYFGARLPMAWVPFLLLGFFNRNVENEERDKGEGMKRFGSRIVEGKCMQVGMSNIEKKLKENRRAG